MKVVFDDLPVEMRRSLRARTADICRGVARAMRVGMDSAQTLAALRGLLPWVLDEHLGELREMGEMLIESDRVETWELDRIVLMLIEDMDERLAN